MCATKYVKSGFSKQHPLMFHVWVQLYKDAMKRRRLTLHVLGHNPVVYQPVVLNRPFDHFNQQVIGGGPGRV